MSNSNDSDSDIYITLIIKLIFLSENERTVKNGIWVQFILETIFDEKYFLTKIDTEVIDSWIETLVDKEHTVIIISKFIHFFVMSLKYFIFI